MLWAQNTLVKVGFFFWLWTFERLHELGRVSQVVKEQQGQLHWFSLMSSLQCTQAQTVHPTFWCQWCFYGDCVRLVRVECEPRSIRWCSCRQKKEWGEGVGALACTLTSIKIVISNPVCALTDHSKHYARHRGWNRTPQPAQPDPEPRRDSRRFFLFLFFLIVIISRITVRMSLHLGVLRAYRRTVSSRRFTVHKPICPQRGGETTTNLARLVR